MRCAEHRFNPRFASDFTVYVIHDGYLIEATAINISLQGVLIERKRLNPAIGESIKICCIISRRYHELSGTVSHSNGGKIGICFSAPHPTFLKMALTRATKRETLLTA